MAKTKTSIRGKQNKKIVTVKLLLCQDLVQVKMRVSSS